MRVLSPGGLPVSSIVWQSSAGAWALTAVCKLTFRLEPGVAAVAEQQEPVNEDDNHWNDDAARSLVAPSDLAPFKPRADVVVVGHAFAPERRPVRSLVVRVCVGEVDKSVEVVCDRAFEPDGRVAEASPFAKMPLRYERASGGSDLWNPVGVSFEAPPDTYGRTPIANLQPLGTFVQWKGDRFGPIGLGPIAPTWPGRLEKLYHYARRWSHRDWHAHPLPADIAMAYFNCAPSDQQTDTLHSNERLLLEHLHPTHPRLVTSLPGLTPRALVERASGHRQEMALVADTLWIDTDRAICTVTWRGRIGLVHPREEGVVRIDVEGLELPRGEPPGLSTDSTEVVLSEARAVAAATPAARAPHDATVVGLPGAGAAAAHHDVTAPRGPGAAAAAHHDATAAQGPGAAVAAAPVQHDASVTLAPGLAPLPRSELPFEKSPWRVSPLAAGSASRPEIEVDSDAGATMYLPPSKAPEHETLPFARPSRPQPTAVLPVAVERVPVMPATAMVAPVASLPALAALTPISSLPLQRPAPHTEQERMASPPLVAFSTAADASLEAPAPPPLIGPLTRLGSEPAVGAAEETSPKEREAPSRPVQAPKAAPPPAPPEPDLETYTIERCAGITVAMACRPADTAKILEENELSEKNWSWVKNHWLEAIRKELGKGKNTLLKRYDVAYVAQVETERGPIGVAEYARLSVAAERGQVGEAVAEMGLPSGAPIRIERVWMERMARDAAFGEKVRAAVEEGRRE